MTHQLEQNFTTEENKKIVTTPAAFGILRKGLIANLGTKRAKGFLLRYGWSIGESDAKEAMKINSSLDFLLNQASIFHLRSGQIGDVEAERYIEFDENQEIKSFQAVGKWIDSFEVKEHLTHYGPSDEPVCHTLTGYASGYMSTVCNKKIIVKETSCIGKGDAECCYEVRLEKDWGSELEEENKYYQEKRIVDELEYTYEQLLKEKNYIKKVSTFHSMLTESVSNGSDLQEISDIAYRLLGIPVTIEDLGFQKIVFSGINEEDYCKLDKDLKAHLLKKNRATNKLPLFSETSRINTANQERLITPIIVQKKIIGYCTLLYLDNLEKDMSNDFLLIERLSNAASLFLLNQKSSFDAFERMKGFFLEQIIKGEYTSKKEIINRGRYMGFDFETPSYIIAVQYTEKGNRSKPGTDHFDEIAETIVKYMDIQGYKALISQFNGQIIMLMPENNQILFIMEKILKHIETVYPSHQYKIGISDKAEDIESIMENVEESLMALRMSADKKIIQFSDLGIVGVLINSQNINGIKKIARQELGSLFSLGDGKKKELLKTLYVFLSNGGKLQQTMDDLSLSMSGLMYRINKIEQLINKDLRDPSQSYQLLLILDSLQALGELDI